LDLVLHSGYEVESEEGSLDHLSKAECGGNKGDRSDMKIFCQRIHQICKYFLETDHEPVLGQSIGHFRKRYVDWDAEIFRERYRFRGRMLE